MTVHSKSLKMLHTFLLFSLLVCASAFASPLKAQDFQYPLSIAANDDGTIYVADRNLPGIWKVKDGQRQIFFQGSKKFRTPLNAVRCVALDHKGNLLAGDSSTREVYRFDKSGEPTPLTDGGIGIPMDIAVDSQGNLFVADLEIHRIWKIPADGGKPEVFVAVPAPRGLTIDSKDHLWVVSHGKKPLLRISPEGDVQSILEKQTFQFAHTLVLDNDQTACITDGYAKGVWKVDSSGKVTKWISGKPLINPVGIARQKEKLLVVDPHAKAIFVADREGQLSRMKTEPRPKKE